MRHAFLAFRPASIPKAGEGGESATGQFLPSCGELDAESFGGPPIIASFGGKSLHEQSHGESFFSLFLNRFGGGGLYILDEPEAALSPMRQMALLSVMHDLLRRGSQFIIATHSPIVMAYPEATIYEMGERGIERVPYEDTDHYQLTKGFLNNPRRALRELLAP